MHAKQEILYNSLLQKPREEADPACSDPACLPRECKGHAGELLTRPAFAPSSKYVTHLIFHSG